VVEDYVDKTKIWSFNEASNKAIKKSKGGLLVFIQDSIWFKPDALEKFYFHFQRSPQACVSGIGDQYSKLDKNGKPVDKVWLDPRKRTDIGTLYECRPEDWELNFCSLPRQLIYTIGGFDEELDRFYGMDNVAVAYRLDSIGARFYLDQTNESFTLQHGRRKDWNENHWMKHGFWDFLKGRSPKLEYLP